MENLEDTTPTAEVVTPTQVEGEKPTSPEEEPTLGKTYTQKELDEAVGKGVSSVQSQLTLQKAEVDKLKATLAASEEALQERENAYEALMEKSFADDPEALDGYKDKRARQVERQQIAKDRAALEDQKTVVESQMWAVTMNQEYQKASKEYQVPLEAVEECRTVESLWKMAKLFPKVEEEPPKPKKFASGAPSDVGVDTENLSAREQIALGYQQAKAKKSNGR